MKRLSQSRRRSCGQLTSHCPAPPIGSYRANRGVWSYAPRGTANFSWFWALRPLGSELWLHFSQAHGRLTFCAVCFSRATWLLFVNLAEDYLHAAYTNRLLSAERVRP